MISWNNDSELFQIMRRELFSAVLGDIMDQLGYRHQFLPPKIQPLHQDMIVGGRAFPVLETDIDENSLNKVSDKPFGLMLEALDNLKKNEVYICTGASASYALWGELMSKRAKKLGCTGAVVNGYSRDTRGILSMGFPTFSHGRYAQDQAPRGKVVDYKIPIKLGETSINPGDVIFGDIDGVCIIPQKLEKTVITEALQKAKTENKVGKAIEEGMSAGEAFDKFGVM